MRSLGVGWGGIFEVRSLPQWSRNHRMCSLGEAANAATAKLLKDIALSLIFFHYQKSFPFGSPIVG
jgi:hypothetical protein